MKRRTLFRLISFILVFAMLFELAPATVFATPGEGEELPAGMGEDYLSEPDTPEESGEEEEAASEAEPAVLGEITELREENVKHFRMDNGTYTAVMYDQPVHYIDSEGEWQNVDNSLVYHPNNDGEKGTYRTGAGSFGAVFEESLAEEGKIFSTEDGAVTLFWGDSGENDSEAIDEDEEGETGEETNTNPGVIPDPSAPTQQEPTVSSIVAEVDSETIPVDSSDKYAAFAPGAQRSRLQFRDVLPEIDLRYEINALSIKESIIVNAPCEEYEYGFRLLLDGLTPTMDDAGAISLTDSEGTEQYFIPAPYMIDDNYDFSFGAGYELEFQGDDTWELTLSVDADWMNDPHRAYPVVIDPTIVKRCGTYNGDISSTYVVEGKPTESHPGYQQLYCGKTTYLNTGYQDVYLHVNVLPTIPPNCSVISAAVTYAQNGYSADDSTSSMYVAAYKLTDEGSKPANQSYVDWIHGLTWNTRPGNSSIILDYAKLNNGTAGYYQSWDVTAAAVDWYQYSTTNHGILLKRWDTFGGNKGVLLMNYGSGSPSYFAVNYRNNVGLEEYYSCQTQAVDRAGVAYMGDYSGNLTVVTPLVSFDSVINGYSLNLVYNSANAIYPFTDSDVAGIHSQGYGGFTGAGWKLSAQETLREITLTEYDNTTVYYIVYNDSDGTEHYFRKDSDGKYLDEDGLNLQITKSGSEYTMKERPATSGTNTNTNAKKVFWRGYLTEIHDNNDNIIYFLYNDHEYYANSNIWKPDGTTGQRLTKIVQFNHGGSQSLIAAMVYAESGNYLSRVVDYAGLITNFTYGLNVSGTKFLTSITWPDGKVAYYSYDSTHRRMSGLRDGESGYGLDLDYYYFHHARVVHQVTEKTVVDNTTSIGNAWHAFHHSQQMMEYRFYGADHKKDTVDDIVTRYSFDFTGRTINATNLDKDKNDVLGVSTSNFTKNANTSATNNRMTGASASGMAAVNLLKNSGAEVAGSQNSGAAAWTSIYPSTCIATRAGGFTVNGATISPHNGDELFKISSNTTTGCSRIYQAVYLQANKTYTLSAYVNTQGVVNFSNGGAFIAFYKTTSTLEKKSSYVNYLTSNGIDGGWERICLTYTPDESGQYLATMGVEFCSSAVLAFDDLQLEVGDASSTANLVQYGSFEETNTSNGAAAITDAGTYWTTGTDVAVSTPSHQGSYCMRIYGSLSNLRRAYQTVNINKGLDNTWLLSGWAKANSVANTQPDPDDSNAPDKRYFGMIAEIKYSDNATEKHYIPFNDDFYEWQYTCGIVAPKRTDTTGNLSISTITVYTAYDYNGNTAYFDEISLRAEPVETYKYDSKGNLTAVNATNNNSDSYTYDGPDLAQAKTGVTGTFNYSYDNNHNMTQATTNSSNTLKVTYDGMGNAKTTKWYVSYSPDDWYLFTETNYTSDGNRVSSQTDANNITTTYTYNTGTGNDATQGLKGQLKTSYTGSTYPTTYHYSPDNGRQTMVFQSNRIAAHYSYNDQGFTNAIARKSYSRNSYDANPSGTAQWQSYKFTTDSFGNPMDIYVSSSDNSVPTPIYSDIKLVHYEYESLINNNSINNGRLQTMTYGNNAWTTYTYDRFDQVIRQDFSGGDSNRYFYNSEGALTKQALVKDGAVDTVYTFEYDSLGRLIRSRQSEGGTLGNDSTISEGAMQQRTEHLYDAENRITKQASVLGNRTYTSTYAYNDDVTSNTSGIKDGSLKQVGFTELNKTMSLSYDSLKHLQTVAVNGLYSRSYTYKSVNSLRSTNQISGLSYTANGNTNLSSLSYNYTYDDRGNVTQIKQNGSVIATYEYNDQNQMISETRSGTSYRYTYDSAGNIKGVTNAGKTYGYSNSYWKDLLTSFNGTDIHYEGQNGSPSAKPTSGNPTNWYNGSSFTDLAWAKGRQLISLTKEGSSPNSDEEITYTYDMNGIRSSKDVDGEVHTYLTQNGQVVREKIETGGTTKILDFVYDNNGQPFALCYSTNNGQTFTDYYYVTNLQGDVVRLVNSVGTTAAAYTYDAWGKLLSSSGTMASINPLRYRGYYYDTETGWYYLQSRYYDPTVGRFINADLPEYSAAFSLDDNNLFAYCGDNPVLRDDKDGECWNIIVGAAIGVVSSFIAAKATGQSFTLKDAAIAALIGGAISSPVLGWNLLAIGVSGFVTGQNCYQNGATLAASIGCGILSSALTACFAGSFAKHINGGKELDTSISAGLSATFGTGTALICAMTSKLVTENCKRKDYKCTNGTNGLNRNTNVMTRARFTNNSNNRRFLKQYASRSTKRNVKICRCDYR